MIIDNLIVRLDGVRRSPSGWLARCPSHDDTNPSLSIRKGDKGVLLRCWVGCSIDEICASIGVAVRDLFYDNAQPFDAGAQRQRSMEKALKQKRAKARLMVDARRIDCFREADAVINTAIGVDISTWSDEQLETVMEVISDAWLVLRDEERTKIADAA
ncbi:MAG: hypothetical protein CMH81_07725 [Nitrospiraceae bacterium]|nr:hypothetical protein [Nitrospiraceae bacterium]